MERLEEMEGYLEAVGAQIRWKRARLTVLPELRRHLEDQQEAFEADGIPAEEAERLSIKDMGDPVEIGTALDRAHRPRNSWGMLLLVGLSCCIWLGWQVYSHLPYSYVGDYSLRSGFVLLLGVGVLLGCYFADYTLLRKGALPLALVMTATAFWEVEPLFSHMPLLLPLALALAVYTMRGKGWVGAGCCLLLATVQLISGLSLYYTSMYAYLFLSNVLLLLLVMGKNWFGLPRGAGLGLMLLFVALGCFFLYWRWKPFDDMLTAWRYAHEVNTQWLAQVKLFGTVESAELLERLVPKRRMDWDYGMFLYWVLLQFGWAAFAAVQLPFLTVLLWGWRRCLRLTTALGRLLGEAVLLIFSVQVFLYLVQTLVGIPVSEYPYPFLTSGGTALVIDFALLGLLLSIFRGQSLEREPLTRSFRQSLEGLLEGALKKVRQPPACR